MKKIIKMSIILCFSIMTSLLVSNSAEAKRNDECVYEHNVGNTSETSKLVICRQHDFVLRRKSIHEKINDGGCKIEFIQYKQCRVCGYITEKATMRRVVYEVCSH